MSKMPFTIAITRNETGETETYDSNVIMAGVSVEEGTQMIFLVKNAGPLDLAGALSALRGIEEIELRKHPGLSGLIDYLKATQTSDTDA